MNNKNKEKKKNEEKITIHNISANDNGIVIDRRLHISTKVQ
jgi:hypothetical protein